MRFVVDMSLNGDDTNVPRMLRELAERVEDATDGVAGRGYVAGMEGKVRDINGNTIGTWDVREEDEV